MKITIKLPGGGYILYEKKPMSEDARFTLESALLFFGFIGALLFLIWMLR